MRNSQGLPRMMPQPVPPVLAGCGVEQMRRLQALFEREIPNIEGEIHPEDPMHKNHAAYFRTGQSAVRCIRLAMLASGKSRVARILDLPSGYGRVLRTLKAAFPEAELTACDIDRGAVDFCARALGAIPLYSNEDPALIKAGGGFDLIWCGSLLTHLSSERWAPFLELFRSVLTPGGLFVFTVHGRHVASQFKNRERNYGLSPEAVDGLLADYSEGGFGYRNYKWTEGYGLSLSSPAWVLTQLAGIPEWRLISYWERGWNNHQDVITSMRERSSPTIDDSLTP